MLWRRKQFYTKTTKQKCSHNPKQMKMYSNNKTSKYRKCKRKKRWKWVCESIFITYENFIICSVCHSLNYIVIFCGIKAKKIYCLKEENEILWFFFGTIFPLFVLFTHCVCALFLIHTVQLLFFFFLFFSVIVVGVFALLMRATLFCFVFCYYVNRIYLYSIYTVTLLHVYALVIMVIKFFL